MRPVSGSTSAKVSCIDAWSLAWMIRLLAELQQWEIQGFNAHSFQQEYVSHTHALAIPPFVYEHEDYKGRTVEAYRLQTGRLADLYMESVWNRLNLTSESLHIDRTRDGRSRTLSSRKVTRISSNILAREFRSRSVWSSRELLLQLHHDPRVFAWSYHFRGMYRSTRFPKSFSISFSLELQQHRGTKD